MVYNGRKVRFTNICMEKKHINYIFSQHFTEGYSERMTAIKK